MNLTKYFNFNYLKENFKKSRGILLLLVILVPLLTLFGIIFINKPVNYTKILELIEISWINIFGMYVIPIALSFILFGYVYKKTSVDFINSKPINRKTIFITNTIGGILLITLIQFLTLITLLLSSIFIKEVSIFTGMIVDTFIVMWIAYLFVFFATNLAMTMSGTFLTQIALTMIILFIIPFCLTTFDLLREQHIDENDVTCENADNYMENKNEITNIGTIIPNNNFIDIRSSYTLPFDFIWNNEFYFSNTRNIKMAVLGIVYFAIGLYLFQKRKMENAEESFSKVKIHLFVKALTVFPLLVMVNLIDASSNVFFILLIIIYYFVYDYIVRRKVKLKYSILGIILTLAISQGIILGIENYYPINPQNQNLKISKEDVEKISIELDKKFTLGEYDLNDYYMENEELINLIFESSEKCHNSYEEAIKNTTPENTSINVNSMKINGKFKYKDGKIVEFYAEVLKEDEDKILDILAQDENFVKNLKDKYLEKAIVTFNDEVMLEDSEQIQLEVNKSIKNMTLKEFYKLYNQSEFENYYLLGFHYYKNHTLIYNCLPINISENALKIIADNQNEYVKEIFHMKNNINSTKSIKSICNYNLYSGVLGYDENNPELLKFGNYFSHTSDLIEEFISENIDEKIDPTKKCYAIQLSELGTDNNYFSYDYSTYFFTNKTEEIDEIIKKEISFYDYDEYYDL